MDRHAFQARDDNAFCHCEKQRDAAIHRVSRDGLHVKKPVAAHRFAVLETKLPFGVSVVTIQEDHSGPLLQVGLLAFRAVGQPH